MTIAADFERQRLFSREDAKNGEDMEPRMNANGRKFKTANGETFIRRLKKLSPILVGIEVEVWGVEGRMSNIGFKKDGRWLEHYHG